MIERDIYHHGRLVVTQCRRMVTADELMQSAHWMVNHFGEEIQPGFCQLFDALGADTRAITEEDIHHVAHINLNHGRDRGHFSMAIVADQPYQIALAKLHKILSEAAEISVEIFAEIDPALQWLARQQAEDGNKFMDKSVIGYE